MSGKNDVSYYRFNDRNKNGSGSPDSAGSWLIKFKGNAAIQAFEEDAGETGYLFNFEYDSDAEGNMVLPEDVEHGAYLKFWIGTPERKIFVKDYRKTVLNVFYKICDNELPPQAFAEEFSSTGFMEIYYRKDLDKILCLIAEPTSYQEPKYSVYFALIFDESNWPHRSREKNGVLFLDIKKNDPQRGDFVVLCGKERDSVNDSQLILKGN